jgi:hypothetical protein
MKTRYDDGDTFERNGVLLRVNIEHDDSHGAPWDEHDGHGPVSDWTRRDKRPGELILSTDRGFKRFYDLAEANRIARRDGWGLSDDEQAAMLARLSRPRIVRRVVGAEYRVIDGLRAPKLTHETVTIPGRDATKPLTRGEIRAAAVARDYEYLRRYCEGQWHYVGVIVTPLCMADDEPDDDMPNDYGFAVWGIESDASDYIAEIVDDLADEASTSFLRSMPREVMP